jgi:hypothetical protein
MPVILHERAAEDWMNPGEEDPLSLKRLLVFNIGKGGLLVDELAQPQMGQHPF